MASHKKGNIAGQPSQGRTIPLTVPQYKLLQQFALSNETLLDYGVFTQTDWQTIQSVINKRMRSIPIAVAARQTGTVVRDSRLQPAMGQ